MLYHFFLCIALSLTLCGCHEKPTPPQRPPVTVSIITVEKRDVPAIFEYVGIAESSHLVEIRARVEGYLDQIAYKEGDFVIENQLLFQIDPKPFEVTLAREQSIQDAREADYWDTQQITNRLRPLYAQKAASQRDLDNAIANELAAQANLEAAKANVMQAEINLGYTTIRSPIPGYVNQAKYREGALVGPGSQQTLLTTVYVMDPIWVNFNIPESDLLRYRSMTDEHKLLPPKDMDFKIEVVLSDGSTLASTGKIDFTDPALQQNTGSMIVRAIINNPGNIVRPGQFVRTKVMGATYLDAVVIPQTAVMQGAKGLFVFVLDSENKVVMRTINAGSWYGDNGWMIDSGLNIGDRVIVEGINKVIPGMTVNIASTNTSSSPQEQTPPPFSSKKGSSKTKKTTSQSKQNPPPSQSTESSSPSKPAGPHSP